MPKLIKQFYLIVAARKRTQFSTALELTTPRVVIGSCNKTPKLNAGEVAIRMTLELPSTLFQKPALTATVQIAESAVSAPIIEADVINNIKELVAENCGIQLTIEQATPRE